MAIKQDMDRRIDEWVEETKKLTGKEVHEREPWNNEVTLDAIKHFVYGTDDKNPLYRDENYAKDTKHGNVIAPPGFLMSVMYPILHGAKMKAPLSSLIGGVEYEWYKQINLGDKLRAYPKQKKFFEKENKAGRRLNFVISEITYKNQNDEIVGKAKGTMIMAAQEGDELMFEKEFPQYSEQQINEFHETFLNEQITGNSPLYFEDVSIGEEIPSILRGPLTIGDMVAWNAAIGPSYKAGSWGFLDLQKGLHTAVKNPVTGFLQKNSQQHEDFKLAAGRGMPGPFDNGVMRCAWVAPLVTNWMGDNGFLKRLNVQVSKPGIYGDVTTYSGKVVEKIEEKGIIKLEIVGKTQDGEVSTKGEAEVILPKK